MNIQSVERRRLLAHIALGAVSASVLAAASASSVHGATPSADPAKTAPRPGNGKIVVTAPTGDIGGQVVQNLMNSGANIRVIARNPERLSQQIRERAEIVKGSHSDLAVCNEAFQGADSVFWLCPPDDQAKSVTAAYVDFTRPACEAIKTQRIRRVVSISALGRGTPQAATAGFVTGSLAMDDLIASTGVAFRALVMPSFMDNIARQADAIKKMGMFFSPINGDLKLPSCATRDIAASAATLLLDPSWNGQGHLAVLGPEDISFNDMARIMSDVLGKAVRFQQTSFEDYKAMFVKFGMSDAMAQGMTDMARAKNEGIDKAERRTRENTTPTTFRQWCEEKLKPLMA